MNHEKQRKARRLFDAMELIDDVILTEAQTPTAARAAVSRRHKRLTRWIAVACAFTVIGTGILGTVVTGVLGGTLLAVLLPLKSESSSGLNETPQQAPVSLSLPTLLADAARDGRGTPTAPDDIDFFDGSVKIIWCETGADVYYVSTLSSASLSDRIESTLAHGGAPLSPEEADTAPPQVWIAYGDGRVVSPYLKASNGNVGAATLFDYAPEITPDEALTLLLADAMIP